MKKLHRLLLPLMRDLLVHNRRKSESMFGKSRIIHSPSTEAITEAARNPDGWVYKILGNYSPDDNVPPEAIIGAWKVDQNGKIVGEFVPNPNFEESLALSVFQRRVRGAPKPTTGIY